MNKILGDSALLTSIGLYGCATGNINKVTLADLTARNINVDEKKRNY